MLLAIVLFYFRLVLSWLTYRLPALDGVNKETEELARKYSKQDWTHEQVSARKYFKNGALRRLAKRCPPRYILDDAQLSAWASV